MIIRTWQGSDFSNWIEGIIEDMRMSAEWEIEEEEYADEDVEVM